jgi:hypothetical protein
MLKTLRFIVLLLSTLTVGMKLAHVLELAPKLQLASEIYLVVQTNLYRLFATLGPIFDVGMVVVALVLLARVYRQPAFRYTAVSVAAMFLSLIVWGLFVLPANAPINAWLATGTMPEDWMKWRDQWQYGQALSFVCDLIAYCVLLFSVIRETPERESASNN